MFGARAVTLHGISWSLATASTVVDVTAEFLAEVAFTGIGLGILLARAPNSALAVPLEVGLGLAVMAAARAGLAAAGRGTVVRAGLAGGSPAAGSATRRTCAAVLQAELSLIYGHAGRLAVGFLHPPAGLARHRRGRLDHLPRARGADRLRRCAGDRGAAERRPRPWHSWCR